MIRTRRHVLAGAVFLIALGLFRSDTLAVEEKLSVRKADLEQFVEDMIASLVRDAKEQGNPLTDSQIRDLRKELLDSATQSLQTRHVALRTC